MDETLGKLKGKGQVYLCLSLFPTQHGQVCFLLFAFCLLPFAFYTINH